MHRTALLVLLVQIILSSGTINVTHKKTIEGSIHRPIPECKFSVTDESKRFFKSRLVLLEPHFIRLQLDFLNKSNIVRNDRPGLFKPDLWVWTYSPPRGHFPYLSWSIEHEVLSFKLLGTKTFNIEFIALVTNQKKCSLALGSETSTQSISRALSALVQIEDEEVPQYIYYYFCHFSKMNKSRNTVAYKAAVYLKYPAPYIRYRCCEYRYNFFNSSYQPIKCNFFISDLNLCTIDPYILGVIILLYFPIVLFRVCAFISKGDQIVARDLEMHPVVDSNNYEIDDWIYLDGTSPITISNTLSYPLRDFRKHHPVAMSRLRRFLCTLVTPCFIYLEMFMFKDGYITGHTNNITIYVNDMVNAGVPVGFLSLFGDKHKRMDNFVPALGGPVGVMTLYFSLAFVLIVLPRSLKQIVENGLPSHSDGFPLLIGFEEILSFSSSSTVLEPGYERASVICRNSVYMVFSERFWRRVLRIQRQRFKCHGIHSNRCVQICLTCIMFIFKLIFCIFEALCCFVFYVIPFFMFSLIMIKGAVRTIMETRHSFKRRFQFLNRTVIWIIVTLIISLTFVLFTYCLCLVFLESFVLISQIAIYCFIALVLFPTISFGYLFFFTAFVYYIAHLVQRFGDGYSHLLEDAIKLSIELDTKEHRTFIKDSTLYVPSVSQSIKTVIIHDCTIEVPVNAQMEIQLRRSTLPKVKCKGLAHGIPKELFERIVNSKRPIYVKLLNLVFHFALIMTLITVSIRLTSQFNSEFTSDESEMLHIVFTVVVGVIPRVVEMFLKGGSDAGKKQIERGEIERIIHEYWGLVE